MGHRKGAGKESEEKTAKEIAYDCFGISAAIAFCSFCGIKITVGGVYIYDCSLQPMVPIFLIGSGMGHVFLMGSGNRNKRETKFMAVFCTYIALLFNIAWAVAGSVWIYPTWKRMGNVSCEANGVNCKSCNEAVLKFAFAMVTIDWICLLLVSFYISCLIYSQL